MTSEPIDHSEVVSFDQSPNLPRLRIYHFLAWTSVMAVMFAVLDGTKLFEPSLSGWATTVIIVEHVLSSAALTCVGLGIFWWWHGLKFPSEPGHGLAILYGIAVLLLELVLVLFSLFIGMNDAPASANHVADTPSWAFLFIRWSGLIGTAVFVSLCGIFSLWLASSWQWRTVFILLGLNVVAAKLLQSSSRELSELVGGVSLNDFVFWANMLVDAIPTGLILLFVGMAALEDRRLAILRHWSHWVGVMVCSGGCALELIKYAVWHLVLDGV